MNLLPLPQLSEQALISRSIGPDVRLAIRLIITCLDEVCAGVADDCSEDIRHDDATSRGGLRWRRTRNYSKKVVDGRQIAGLETAVADVSDNALQIRVGGCAVSFYAARNGIEEPDLSGPSKTKRRVVNEMQMQLDGLEAPAPPRRLVILYQADQDGLAGAAVGMMSSSTSWAWRFSVYHREGLGRASSDSPPLEPPMSYEDEPEPELPPIEPLDEDAAEDDEG